MPECRDAKLLQVLRRQVRQDRLVDLILAECSLILSEAEGPQPYAEVHDNAQVGGGAHHGPAQSGTERA